MKNVNKKTEAQIELVLNEYLTAKEDLEAAVEDAQEKINQILTDLNDKKQSVNDFITRLNELREEVRAEIESFIDEKSDNWRDGDRGSAYQEWLSSWENEIEEVSDFDDVTIEAPDLSNDPLDDSDYPREPSV